MRHQLTEKQRFKLGAKRISDFGLVRRTSVSITPEDLEYLRNISPDRSQAIRDVIKKDRERSKAQK